MYSTNDSLLPSGMTENHCKPWRGADAASTASMERNPVPVNPPSLLPKHTGLLVGAEVDSDRFLRKIVDTCAASVAVLDELGTVLYVNRAWGPLAVADGPDESKNLQGSYLGIGTSPDGGVNALAEDIQRITAGRAREFHKEYSVPGDDGPVWLMMHAARLDLPGSERFRILVTREDVTRQREAEEALRNLGGRLITAQEEERSRVARELHDNLNQQLALMSIELEQLERKIQSTFPALSVSNLQTRAQEIASAIHQLSYQLHPAKLDHLGLAAATKSLCAELSERHEITIEFSEQGFPSLLPQDVTLCLFRITQEALQNAITHSGTRKVEVQLRRTASGVYLRISDLGCGFDVHSPQAKGGLGFISMRERLRLVGGTIAIQSQPSSGTQIDVLVPVEGGFKR